MVVVERGRALGGEWGIRDTRVRGAVVSVGHLRSCTWEDLRGERGLGVAIDDWVRHDDCMTYLDKMQEVDG